MRGDTRWAAGNLIMLYFNPLSPCRVIPGRSVWACIDNYNPLSPCGKIPQESAQYKYGELQSTLPLRGDTCQPGISTWDMRFQSTFPMWGDTCDRRSRKKGPGIISIHFPHVGRYTPAHRRNCGLCYFNPLSPCGEIPEVIELLRRILISIHSPHEGRYRIYFRPHKDL